MHTLDKLKIVRLLGMLIIPLLMLMLLACDSGNKNAGYLYTGTGLYGGGGQGTYLNPGPQIEGPGFHNNGFGGGYGGFGGNSFFPRGSCLQNNPHYFQNGALNGFGGAPIYNHSGLYNHTMVRPPYVNSYDCPIYIKTSCNSVISQNHYDAANYLQQAMENFQGGRFTEGYRLVGEAESANPNDEEFGGYLKEFKTSTESIVANRDWIKMYEANQHEGFYHDIPDETEIFTDIGNIGESLGGYLRWAVFNRVHNIVHPLSTWAHSLESAEEYNRVNAYGFNSMNSWQNHWSSYGNGGQLPPNCN